MRLIIVREDKYVSIDGVGYHDMDMSSIPSNIHAVQWYDDEGEIEYITIKGTSREPNKRITSLDDFQTIISLWEQTDQQKKIVSAPQPPTIEDNLITAKGKLNETDYAVLPDVKIVNLDQFIEYREWLRNFLFDPKGGIIDWPIKPQPVWIN